MADQSREEEEEEIVVKSNGREKVFKPKAIGAIQVLVIPTDRKNLLKLKVTNTNNAPVSNKKVPPKTAPKPPRKNGNLAQKRARSVSPFPANQSNKKQQYCDDDDDSYIKMKPASIKMATTLPRQSSLPAQQQEELRERKHSLPHNLLHSTAHSTTNLDPSYTRSRSALSQTSLLYSSNSMTSLDHNNKEYIPSQDKTSSLDRNQIHKVYTLDSSPTPPPSHRDSYDDSDDDYVQPFTTILPSSRTYSSGSSSIIQIQNKHTSHIYANSPPLPPTNAVNEIHTRTYSNHSNSDSGSNSVKESSERNSHIYVNSPVPTDISTTASDIHYANCPILPLKERPRNASVPLLTGLPKKKTLPKRSAESARNVSANKHGGSLGDLSLLQQERGRQKDVESRFQTTRVPSFENLLTLKTPLIHRTSQIPHHDVSVHTEPQTKKVYRFY